VSKDESKGYRFTIDSNSIITAVYEIEKGKTKLKKMDGDETWSFDGTVVTKTEVDDDEIEITTYSDTDGDGTFTEVGEVKSSSGVTANTERYRFDIAADGSVTSAYELDDTKWKTDRISINETYILQGLDVVKTETEHGFIETTTFMDEDGDGLYVKTSKSYARTDGTTVTFISDDDHGDDDNDGWSGTDDDDVFYGAAGNDTLVGGNGNDDLSGGVGDDRLSGGSGDDVLYATSGNDVVDGGTGNDLIIGGDGTGNDVYKGGAGVDTATYTSAKAGIAVNLYKSVGTAGSVNKKIKDAAGIGSDKLYDIENIIGGSFDDILTGSNGANTINGEAGNDSINGGLGADVLIGGTGADRFIFNTKRSTSNVDTITDFGDGADKIVFSKSLFGSLKKGIVAGNIITGNSSELAAYAFDKNDFLIYNTETGMLSYDADGSGKAAAVAVAEVDLVGIASLAHTDFIVV